MVGGENRRMTMFKELESQREEIESYLEKVSSIGIVLIDSARNIQDCNHGFTKIFQLKQKPVGSPLADFLILGDSDLKQPEEIKLSCNHQSGVNGFLHCRAVETESGYLINLQRETVKKNLLLEKLRRELNERIAEIEATLARVKQLEGIIPICTHCKQIRDDQDDWHKLEKYITEHSEAQFSHGICPACFEKEMKNI
jgi:PAS domain-containing protein